MTINRPENAQTLGTLHTEAGTGLVHLEARLDTSIDAVWSVLTEPAHLRHWLGEVQGELRPGGTFHARFTASGWEGTGHIDECEPPHRLRISTSSPDQPLGVIEAVLTGEGSQTHLVVEDRGMPIAQLPAYGAGDQIHLEDLAAYLAGGERCDARARWQELHPAYQALAADLA